MDKLERDAMILKHLPWIKGIAKRAAAEFNCQHLADELEGDVILKAVKLAETFNPVFNVPFQRYASRALYSEAIRSLKRNEQYTKQAEFIEVPDNDAGVGEVEAQEVLIKLLKRLNLREREIVRLRIEGCTVREIASFFGISGSRVGQILQKIKQKKEQME